MGINKRNFGKGVIYGYGIPLNHLSCGNVISFITKHRGVIQSLYPESEMDDMLGCLYHSNKIDADDYDMIIFDHGMDFFPYIVGLVLNIDYGTTEFLGLVGEESFDDCIIWQCEGPWDETIETEDISHDKLNDIFKTLVDELGIREKPVAMALEYDDFPKGLTL